MLINVLILRVNYIARVGQMMNEIGVSTPPPPHPILQYKHKYLKLDWKLDELQ